MPFGVACLKTHLFAGGYKISSSIRCRSRMELLLIDKFEVVKILHTSIYSPLLQTFSKDYKLASYTTYVVCVNFYTYRVASSV